MTDVTRFVDILVKGRWRKRPFAKLRKNDLFRMYEEDGCPVEELMVNVALGEPYVIGQTLGIRCDPAGRRR